MKFTALTIALMMSTSAIAQDTTPPDANPPAEATPPATDMTAPPADTAPAADPMTATTPPTAAAPTAGAKIVQPGPSVEQAFPPPAPKADYPWCSRTVTDSCKNRRDPGYSGK